MLMQLELYGMVLFIQCILAAVRHVVAHIFSAQPCMVMKLKDVGKLPHSRITTYGQTEWHQSHPAKDRYMYIHCIKTEKKN